MKKIGTHTVDTANEVIRQCGLSDFLKAVRIDTKQGLLVVLDSKYGEYPADLKTLCESAKGFPLHKRRRHENKTAAARLKYVGKKINGLEITDLFYGPDMGYRNRSFVLEYKGTCGHRMVATLATILKHKKTFTCRACSTTDHGERSMVDGVRKSRTPSYVYWSRNHHKFPEAYRDFKTFVAAAGEKPKRADLQFVEGRPVWASLAAADEPDKEVQLMASALRQAFRYSDIYKAALEKARVETGTSTKYRCTACQELSSLNDVQVDHINPISALDGAPLTKQNVIEKVWTSSIQILDRKCHTKKSAAENAERRKNKRLR